MNNGSLNVELGKGTLYTAVASQDGYPVGLAFTNNKDGTLDNMSIVIQITTEEALASYLDLTMRYLKLLMETSENGVEDIPILLGEIQDFQNSIKYMLPSEKK